MKQDKHILRTFIIVVLTFLIGGYQTCEAQLVDGNYYYSNSKQDVTLIVTDVGLKVDLLITKRYCKECISAKGNGEWIYINLKGADENYEGPNGWYDIKIKNKYVELEFDDFNNKVQTYETLKIPTANSKEKTILKLTHYYEEN